LLKNISVFLELFQNSRTLIGSGDSHTQKSYENLKIKENGNI